MLLEQVIGEDAMLTNMNSVHGKQGKESNCVLAGLGDALYHCFSLVTFTLEEQVQVDFRLLQVL